MELLGTVEFRDVSFGYRKGEEVLKHISFTAEKGETVAPSRNSTVPFAFLCARAPSSSVSSSCKSSNTLAAEAFYTRLLII
jgi:hypothetical protein